MEFNEKLQQLRAQCNLTQEQLAEQLFVSRTAISKWESGKGYPNIESLKCISKFFLVSIDELLSGDELISLAQTENHSNMERLFGYISGMLDVLAVALIVLPIYGNPVDNYIYHINIFQNTHTPNIDLTIHWTVFLSIIGLGIGRLCFIHFNNKSLYRIATTFSFILNAGAICLFAAAREPYATILLFLFFTGKTFLLFKQSRLK